MKNEDFRLIEFFEKLNLIVIASEERAKQSPVRRGLLPEKPGQVGNGIRPDQLFPRNDACFFSFQ